LLSEYLERFIQVKAHVPNISEATIIAAAIEGLAVGQCVAKISRKPPIIVKEMFKIMGQYAKSDDDFK
jgi:hypothetical protein